MKSLKLSLLALFIVSCTDRSSQDIVVLPVFQNINETRGAASGVDIVKSHRVIPLETSDSVLIGRGWIESVTDDRLILTDNQTVYFFNPADGSLKSKFKRQGRGPGEYIDLGNLELSPDGSKIYISDYGSRNINVYTPEGRSLDRFTVDSIVDFLVDGQGRFFASYPPFRGWRNLVGVYDADWKTLATYFPNPPLGDRVITLWPHYMLSRFNGEPHILLADTLWHLSPERATPMLTHDKGSLRAPEDVALDFRQQDEVGHRYILQDYGRLAGNYYFLGFYYNRGMYFDLWDISTGELLYRNIATGPESKYGVAFNLDGKTVYAWPSFAQGNKVYCLLGFDHYEQTKALHPAFAEEDNPIILELTL
jgi:hypothetical protein